MDHLTQQLQKTNRLFAISLNKIKKEIKMRKIKNGILNSFNIKFATNCK
jgi:hypothetical protein